MSIHCSATNPEFFRLIKKKKNSLSPLLAVTYQYNGIGKIMQVSNPNQSVPQIELNLPRPDNVPSFAGLKQDNVNVAQFTIPSFANQSTSSPSLASNQLTSSTAMSSSTETTKSSKSSSKEDRSELKCRVCAHQDCDLNIFSCGCSFHAVSYKC